jgi:hypothetical protein
MTGARWTREQYEAWMKERERAGGLDKIRPAKPHKYRAQPTTVDGIRFDSKLEARYYEQLKVLEHRGGILGFLRQVPFHLPGKTRLVVDFQVFPVEGPPYFVDTKGFETEVFKVKLRQVKELYPWADIRIVKKGEPPV